MDLLLLLRDALARSRVGTLLTAMHASKAGQEVGVLFTQEALSAVAQGSFEWPRELSGGQRQRAAFARALADEPATLLLDEPFGALDAITRVDVQRTFARLREETRVTVLLVTHDLREAFELADEVAVMRAGGIEQVASPTELRGTPATPYVRELLEKAGVA